MSSKWDYYGQRREQIRDPLGFRIKAAISPWKINPRLKKELDKDKKPRRTRT